MILGTHRFRDYDPGLNRFITRDTYNGALADMNLGADPFTGNRYAFGGGNPITSIEDNGHDPYGCSPTSNTCVQENNKRAREEAGLPPIEEATWGREYDAAVSDVDKKYGANIRAILEDDAGIGAASPSRGIAQNLVDQRFCERVTELGDDCGDALAYIGLSSVVVYLRAKGQSLTPEQRQAITMVKTAAEDELSKGWQNIFNQLPEQDQENFRDHVKEGRYFRAYQVLGKAFHVAVWNNLQANNAGEFTHNQSRDPDFHHVRSGFNVELTTIRSYFNNKLGRGGLYRSAGYVLLRNFPGWQTVRGLGGGRGTR